MIDWLALPSNALFVAAVLLSAATLIALDTARVKRSPAGGVAWPVVVAWVVGTTVACVSEFLGRAPRSAGDVAAMAAVYGAGMLIPVTAAAIAWFALRRRRRWIAVGATTLAASLSIPLQMLAQLTIVCYTGIDCV